MDYSKAVSEMKESISDSGDFGFDEYRNEAEKIEEVQDQVKTIHVAGTNGKGSTCNIIYQMLREQGYSVGLFTGPHLGELVERIEVDGDLIERKQLGSLYEKISDEKFSMFESLVLIALKHFKEKNVDYAVIETGCGGKRDATNIVNSEISVITNVGLDHSHILGDTVEEIAEEKSGIIKEGKPVVTHCKDPALEVVRKKALEKNTEISKPGKHVKAINKRPLKLKFNEKELIPSLRGFYQVKNINTAIETLENLEEFDLENNSIRDSLEKLTVPGRMEKIRASPELVIDGAHNEKGVKALVESIEGFDTIVFGSMEKKPYGKILEMLRPFADNFIFTEPPKDSSWSPETESLEGEVIKDPLDAVEKADGDTLVTGSLYLIGKIRREF